jgi:hypothetical protein
VTSNTASVCLLPHHSKSSISSISMGLTPLVCAVYGGGSDAEPSECDVVGNLEATRSRREDAKKVSTEHGEWRRSSWRKHVNVEYEERHEAVHGQDNAREVMTTMARARSRSRIARRRQRGADRDAEICWGCQNAECC